MTIFYYLKFETVTWKARSPYLCPPVTGWPSYTSKHWVPFSSPPTTCRATVEVFEPTSTVPSSQKARSKSRYIAWGDLRENTASNSSYICCVCISFDKEMCSPSHCLATAVSSGSATCCHMFTAPLLRNARLFQYSGFQPSCHNINNLLFVL
jgi:hypothetical protein